MIIIQTFLIFSLQLGFANVDTVKCVRQAFAKIGPPGRDANMSEDERNALVGALGDADPTMRLGFGVAFDLCVGNLVKEQIAGKSYQTICPNIKSKYKTDCIKSAIKQNPVKTSPGLTLWLEIVLEAAKEDLAINQDFALAGLSDSLLELGLTFNMKHHALANMPEIHKKYRKNLKELRNKEQRLINQWKNTVVRTLQKKLSGLSSRSRETKSSQQRLWLMRTHKTLSKKLELLKKKQFRFPDS